MNFIRLNENCNNFDKYKSVKSILLKGNSDLIRNPLITICIPTYKRTDLLKSTIDSALNQKGNINNYIVLIVDNEETFSETETKKLIDSYKDEKLLYYKNEKNIGMFGNLNRCFELAETHWVSLLHDDDLLKENYLAEIERLLTKKNDIACLCVPFDISNHPKMHLRRHVFVKEASKVFFNIFYKNRISELYPFYNYLYAFDIYNAPTCGMVFKKDVVISSGGFNDKYFPSADWIYLIYFNFNYRVFRTHNSLGIYRWGENETLNPYTVKKTIEQKKEIILALYPQMNPILKIIMKRILYKIECQENNLHEEFTFSSILLRGIQLLFIIKVKHSNSKFISTNK